ncbi:hypothetical protein [Flavobacterium psychrophilum]|uniref:hypothetical protein n=1 Tax=Flavobacterium psychrophilum TaxID=96345 RepID=UPI0015C5E277|nr:hypothetical protein [Flavobacterium psychrophilum]
MITIFFGINFNQIPIVKISAPDRSRATSSLGLNQRYLSDLPNLPNTEPISN